MSYLEKVDRYIDSLKIGKSAIVDSWFMMSSPMPILSVVVAYLIIIRVGPKIMKNRPPLQLNKLLAYYNASQVFLAVMICFKVIRLNLFRDGIIYAGCRYPSNTHNPALLDMGWWYFFAKFTELLDTIFFVLRKKNKQITFLHVYHHVIMALYSWSYLKFAAGGEGAVLALLNSIVHVVMYSYYLLSGLGPRFQKYLWWKKYVTKLQLIQFILMLTYCAWTHNSTRCQYASGFTYFISSNITIFLFLFLNFYSKSYKRRNAKLEMEAKSHNGLKTNTNGICKNGIKQTKENGLHTSELQSNTNIEDIVYDSKAGGDYIEDSHILLTRRTSTSKAVYDGKINFDSLIKK